MSATKNMWRQRLRTLCESGGKAWKNVRALMLNVGIILLIPVVFILEYFADIITIMFVLVVFGVTMYAVLGPDFDDESPPASVEYIQGLYPVYGKACVNETVGLIIKDSNSVTEKRVEGRVDSRCDKLQTKRIEHTEQLKKGLGL